MWQTVHGTIISRSIGILPPPQGVDSIDPGSRDKWNQGAQEDLSLWVTHNSQVPHEQFSTPAHRRLLRSAWPDPWPIVPSRRTKMLNPEDV